MATPPTRVSYNTPSVGFGSSASPKTTNTFDVVAGDLLVVISSGGDSVDTLGAPTATGGSVTWTLRQSVVVNNYCTMYLYTGAVGATATGITVSVARTGGSNFWGFGATVWRDHGGVGVTAKTNVSSGAPSLTLAGTAANSAVQCGSDDWNAADGTTRTWRTINGAPMTESLYFRNNLQYTVYSGWSADVGAGGSVAVGLSAPAGQKYSIVGVEILGTTGSAGTTYDVSGTVAASSSTSGAISRLARTLAVAGTVVALSGVSGDVARVPQVQPVTGTVAAVSGSSGDVSRAGVTQPVSGTVAATSSTSGDVTRPARTLTVTGSADALTTVSGDVTRLGSAPTVSGTVAAVTGTQGAATAILQASGTVTASSGSSGAATRLPRTLTVTGTVAATSATQLGVSVLGGPQTYPVAGTVAGVTSTTGAVRLLASATGTAAATSSTSGDVTVLRAPVVWQVAGTTTATTETSGTVTLRALASGIVAVMSGASGSVVNPNAYRDVTVTSVTGHLRVVTVVEHPHVVAVTGHPRTVTVRSHP